MTPCTSELVEPTELPELPQLTEPAGAPDSCSALVPVHVPRALCSPPQHRRPGGGRGCEQTAGVAKLTEWLELTERYQNPRHAIE